MRRIEKISVNKNYPAVSVGAMDEWKDYSFIHPKIKQEVRGKVFVEEAIKAIGTEISFTALPPLYSYDLRKRIRINRKNAENDFFMLTLHRKIERK